MDSILEGGCEVSEDWSDSVLDDNGFDWMELEGLNESKAVIGCDRFANVRTKLNFILRMVDFVVSV